MWGRSRITKAMRMPEHYVFVRDSSGMSVCEVSKCHAGWTGCLFEGRLDDHHFILLPEGKIIGGASYVKGWIPHSGWTAEELAEMGIKVPVDVPSLIPQEIK